MPDRRVTLLQGTLDLLILKALSAGPLHGLGVSRRIEQITGGTFVVQPGSLFPALHRLEESGWLTSDWQRARPLGQYDSVKTPYAIDYYLVKMDDWLERYGRFLGIQPKVSQQEMTL